MAKLNSKKRKNYVFTKKKSLVGLTPDLLKKNRPFQRRKKKDFFVKGTFDNSFPSIENKGLYSLSPPP